jgi:AraC-like DNA-binding protein
MQFDLKEFQMALEVTRIANAHYFEFVNNYHTVPDRHGFYELVYVDSGKINVRAENYSGELSAGYMIVHGPNEMHELSSDADTAPNVIIVGFECTFEKLAYFSRHAVELTVPFQRMLAEIVKECRNLFLPPYDVPRVFDMKKREDRVFGCDQMVKILLEQFLIKLLRSVERVEVESDEQYADPLITEICAYLRLNFTHRINIRRLCVLFGTNKTTLSASFKRQTSRTIVEYVNGLKIAEAKRLIRLGEKNLTQIAEELNFGSPYYFTKLFIKYEKQPPSFYAQMIKSKLDGKG